MRRHPRLFLALSAAAALLTAWLLWHPLLTGVAPVRTEHASGPFFPRPTGPVYDRPLSRLRLEGVTLADAIDRLAELYGARIVIDWPTLEAAGVSRTFTTSTRMLNAGLGSALNELLSNYNTVELAHHPLDDGAIHVSTARAFARFRRTGEIYFGGDVIYPRFASLPSRASLDASGPPTLFERWGIDTLLRPGPADLRQRTDALAAEITRSIDPASWNQNGPAKDLTVLNDPGFSIGLMVTQSADNHRRVADLLLRRRRQAALAALAAFAGRTLVLVAFALSVTALTLAAARLLLRPHVPGHCPTCGYDLRATPDRCTECGTMPTADS